MPALKEMLAQKAGEHFSGIPCHQQPRGSEGGATQIYQPLDQPSQTIRLISIHPPSDDTSEIECTLYTARLEDDPQFTALSYAWGDPDVTETIIVNGFPLQVTESLATVLRHIRAINFRPILGAFWADGICIDQRNIKERGHQVALMGRLYRQARLVCSWIGVDEDGCCKVMEACHQVGSLLVSEPQDQPQAVQDWLQATHSSWSENKDGAANTIADMDLATRRFAYRPLFWRAWAFQEAVLASSSLFICENVAIEGEHLYRSVAELSEPNHQGLSRPQTVPVKTLMSLRGMAPDLHNITDIYESRKLLRAAGSRGLHFYLKSTIYLKVSNPLDKVFAVIGLAQSDLNASYEGSVTDTYFAAAKHMILNEGSLECLLMAGTDSPPGIEPTEPGIPSWVPDLYAFTQAAIRHLYFGQLAVPAPEPIVRLTAISETDMTLTCDAILLQFGKPCCSVSVNALRETPTALKEYIQRLTAAAPLHPSSVPHLQALFHFLLSLEDGGERYEKWAATFKDQATLLLHSGLKFYTAITSKWPSEYIPLEFGHNTAFPEEFLEDFVGSRDFILHPEWDKLRRTLRFDYDDPITSILVHALQAVREEVIFWTDTGHLGLCSFQLSQDDELFIVPGCSSILALRKVSDHYVLRGPCVVHGFDMKNVFKEVERERIGLARIRLR